MQQDLIKVCGKVCGATTEQRRISECARGTGQEMNAVPSWNLA